MRVPNELLKKLVREGIEGLGFVPRLNELTNQIEDGHAQWTDANYSRLHIELRELAPSSYIDDMVAVMADDERYNPVKEWIDHLRETGWDGTDWIHKLTQYFENPDGLFEPYLKKWMIGAVDRAYNGGTRNPMLVLDGPQESGKSSFVRWLCPKILRKYYREGQIIPNDKDYRLALTRTFIWEVGEVDATTKRAEASALKDFLTISSVKDRDAYARVATERPTISSFIGTFNDIGGFLNDASGSSRFRVCKLSRINWMGYTTDPDDLSYLCWLQAIALWARGETNELDKKEKQRMAEVNDNYTMANNTQYAIEEYFNITPGSDDFVSSNYIREILQRRGLSGMELDARRIASCLRALGCDGPKQKKINGVNKKGWFGISKKLDA